MAKAYQERVQEVRSETQSLMERLRAERIARSQSLKTLLKTSREETKVATAAIKAENPLERIAQTAPATPKVITSTEVPRTTDTVQQSPVEARPKPMTAAFATEFPEGFDAPAEAEAVALETQEAEPVQQILHDPSTEEQNASADEVMFETDLMEESVSQTAQDIADINGIGAGMIWRLNQLGIKTRSDLAGQDVAALTKRLGAIGKLVPVERWIKEARA